MSESNGNGLSSREKNLLNLKNNKNERIKSALTWCKKHGIGTRLNLLDLESGKDQEKEKKRSKFRKTTKELRELDKENNIKLLNLLKYLRKRKAKEVSY
ncbi:hypothetical protein ES705_21679 [subsurface metagenome]